MTKTKYLGHAVQALDDCRWEMYLDGKQYIGSWATVTAEIDNFIHTRAAQLAVIAKVNYELARFAVQLSRTIRELPVHNLQGTDYVRLSDVEPLLTSLEAKTDQHDPDWAEE